MRAIARISLALSSTLRPPVRWPAVAAGVRAAGRASVAAAFIGVGCPTIFCRETTSSNFQVAAVAFTKQPARAMPMEF